MTSEKVLSDAQLRQSVVDEASKGLIVDGLSDLFNLQEVDQYDIIIPLDVRGDDLLCYRVNANYDDEGNITSIKSGLEEEEAYKLKRSTDNTVYASDLKDLQNPENITKIGFKAMNLAIRASGIATGGVYEEGEVSPNQTLEEDYKVNGIDYEELKNIRQDLSSYHAEMYSSGSHDAETIEEINKIGAEISEVLTELDLYIVAPKIIENFKEQMKASDELSYNQTESLINRVDSGSDITEVSASQVFKPN